MFRLPPDSELKHAPRAVVTVVGLITEIDPDRRSASGARHQIFSVRVDEIRSDAGRSGVSVGEVVNVAVRYGDATGLANPVPRMAVGQEISLCGSYIVLQSAYPEADGDRNAVIHYTHHPVGWVEYQGRLYQ